MNSAMFKRAVAVAGAALLAGCAGIHEHRGAVIDRELASAIQVGVDNKDSVAKTLGRPTFTGQFNPNDWYYVSRDTKTVALRGVGVLASAGLIEAIISLPLRLTATTLPAWSKRTWSTVWSTTPTPRMATVLVSRDT